MNRRDFVKTTAAAYSLYVVAGGNPVLAAGAEDDLAKLTISEASRRLRAGDHLVRPDAKLPGPRQNVQSKGQRLYHRYA